MMINSKQWVTDKEYEFYSGQQRAISHYNTKITERRERYKQINHEGFKKYQDVIDSVNTKGYAKIENFFDLKQLDLLANEFRQKLKTGEHIKSVQDGSHLQLMQPFLNSDYVLDIALDERLVDIATTYYRCIPALGSCNLRRSSAEFTKNNGTNSFHRDFNSPVKFIKFFVYLNDVDVDNGPFTYVEGSNKKMPVFWKNQHRWQDAQIVELYGKDSIIPLTANYGDLLMATTIGFHKGGRITKGTRDMLTLNYVIAPELKGQTVDIEAPRFLVSKKKLNSLNKSQIPLADFLYATTKE
tara:strand:- start:557 stop:1450 length:894 start_codon:yes stop_codon:yes gene_type:complete